MKRLRSLVTAALLAASPFLVATQAAPAPAPTNVITTLNTICVAAQGDPARAAVLAGEAGYSPAPETMMPRMRNATQRAAFIRSNATDITFVMTGRMTRDVGRDTVVLDFCGVSARPTDHRTLETTLRRMMGFAPVNAGGQNAYAWLQTPEGRAPSRSLSDAQFVAMAATGQMRLVALDRSGPGSTLMYLRPHLD